VAPSSRAIPGEPAVPAPSRHPLESAVPPRWWTTACLPLCASEAPLAHCRIGPPAGPLPMTLQPELLSRWHQRHRLRRAMEAGSCASTPGDPYASAKLAWAWRSARTTGSRQLLLRAGWPNCPEQAHPEALRTAAAPGDGRSSGGSRQAISHYRQPGPATGSAAWLSRGAAMEPSAPCCCAKGERRRPPWHWQNRAAPQRARAGTGWLNLG